VPAGSTLLEAAQAADVHVNASCNGKGSCGKCKLVVASGAVESPPTPLLTDAEKEKGYVLACQSRITGDVSCKSPKRPFRRN
jgi:ferredoxin